MNTTKARKLRKQVFGAMKQPTIDNREYHNPETKISPKARRRGFGGFPEVNTPESPRGKYRRAKKEGK